jgi:hypothetical protein
MGFKITLEGERGDIEDTVLDSTHLLNGILPQVSDQTFRCLGYVDEYGVTMFNRMQMPDLIAELERLAEQSNDQRSGLIHQVLGLAQRCRDELHMYVKFRGD